MELNVLSLGGSDVVLGTQWLFTLGLIQWDFQKQTMEFNYQGNPILIKGLQPSGLELQDLVQFFKPIVKKGLCLQILSTTTASVPGQSQPAIKGLLTEFSKVFELPTGLPPLRGHEHQILLKEGT